MRLRAGTQKNAEEAGDLHLKTRFHGQMSDTFHAAVFVTLSGGFQDAYTYICRGQVFANAQTGNIVLLSAALLRGDWAVCLKYVIPLLSFVFGTMAAECIHMRFRNFRQLHWRQLVLIQEIAFLLIVGFLPHSVDPLANALVSFVCAMQVHTFHKVHGHAYASTMCIGNLRSGMESLCAYWKTQNRTNLQKSFCYWGIILMFAIGAALGVFCVAAFGARAIWISCLLLSVSFLFMFAKEDMEELKEEIEEIEEIEEKKLF